MLKALPKLLSQRAEGQLTWTETSQNGSQVKPIVMSRIFTSGVCYNDRKLLNTDWLDKMVASLSKYLLFTHHLVNF